jgi:methionyl-tRNA synthetase
MLRRALAIQKRLYFFVFLPRASPCNSSRPSPLEIPMADPTPSASPQTHLASTSDPNTSNTGTSDKSTFYATTPIFYVNAEPHIGHAFTTTLVDVVTRMHRLRGDDTFFLTGTDEHGEKVHKAAEQNGMSAQAYTDLISGKFKSAWDNMNIAYDDFIRTTEDRHKEVVQAVLQRVYDSGDIFYGEYSGLYCVGAERFVTEKELVDGLCPDDGKKPEHRSEANYFFRMEKYRLWLRDYIEDNPDLIRPERYRNEVLAMLREPIGDLSISRPKSRVPWGIPLPWDDDHVTYVWFDALINYYSVLEHHGTTNRYWPAVNHFIAKDIVKPHGVFWPTMLKAAGLPVYKHLNVHGYWLIDGTKMSKSRGNVVRPLDLQAKYGNDAFRYFLLRDMTFGLDASFSEVALAERINSDLANDLGNLLNRTLGMLGKYRGGVVPQAPSEASETTLQDVFAPLVTKVSTAFDNLQFDRAIESVLEAVRRANKYIADTKPWDLAKDDNQSARLDEVLYNCIEALRCASVLLEPIIPNKSKELRAQLGLTASYTLNQASTWGLTPAGTQTQAGEPLFPRVDLSALQDAIDTDEDELVHKDEITIDDFAKLELRVAEVVRAEHHPKADKLLVLHVKLGPETRTIVSGIKQWYSPEELTGKKVIIVANLKPVKLRGIESQGMILAAENADGNLSISALDKDIASGSEVR